MSTGSNNKAFPSAPLLSHPLRDTLYQNAILNKYQQEGKFWSEQVDFMPLTRCNFLNKEGFQTLTH